MRLPLRQRGTGPREMLPTKSYAPPASVKGRLRGRPLFNRQLKVLLWKQYILLASHKRHWISTAIQLFGVPLLVLLVLFIVQQAMGGDGQSSVNAGRVTWDVPGLDKCTPQRGISCVTLMYTPDNEETTQIMSKFASNNAKRVSKAPALESGALSLDAEPSRDLGIIAVPSKEFIYDFAMKQPMSSHYAIAFDKQTSGGNTNYQYQIWYNFTSTSNNTVYPDSSPLEGSSRDTRLDDPFGSSLLSIMRGVDEAILASVDSSAPTEIRARLRNFPDIGRSVYMANKDSVWFFGGIFLFLPSMLLFITTLTTIVREKSLRLRECMDMM
ncbi:hypothetical protein THASP1DRAFT_32880 [Thamnocephalis sphaerospora]|uniref:Uncharacterized protein n=1 Tax=Thamnocephalis sphaerospora TaxID=78915 RepID=A0A4V1IVU5_9FUNG|nr:hypothetical protein THASP1DRAFT_32880 [Thamnocephalis sphaerospora]|eukprot:RKP05279.1 hypothetical protein THASP1DRAFT_32880 [Thamnocephalis sphaerospora]